MMIGGGERLMVSTMEKVAFNHVCRYRWAIHKALELGAKTVIDGACGIGYGSRLAAEKGLHVYAIDRSEDAEPYQRNFAHPLVMFNTVDCADAKLPAADIAFTIETVEHLDDDLGWLKKLRAACKFLVVTVPNQDVVRFIQEHHRWHKRHYTKFQLAKLLEAAGWEPMEWHTQYEKWDRDKAQMRPGDDGMTLGVICK